MAVLKGMIRSSELQVPVCRQILTGWPADRTPHSDSTILSSLHLPTDIVLQLAAIEGNGDDEESINGLTRSYMLVITDATHGNRVHHVNFHGDKTYLGVKVDVSDLTDIPVRHQVWTGWPDDITDDTVIGLSGINYPTHKLTVRSTKETNNRPPPNEFSAGPSVQVVSDDDGDSTADEYEDASDVVMEDMFMAEDIPSRPQPLMPDGVEDEAVASIHFAEGKTKNIPNCFAN